MTGVGIVTAMGLGWEANSAGFRQGRCALRPVQGFDVRRQRAQMAGEVDLPSGLPPTALGRRAGARLDRAGRMLLWAADEAVGMAGWARGGAGGAAGAGEELPVVLGTTSGGMGLGQDFYRMAARMEAGRTRRGQATRVTHYQPQRQVLDLMDAFGFRGPSMVIANACASGSNAIGRAFEWVRSGRADRVLTGGYDALSALVFAGFDALQALSTTRCRPFDAGRDGLALGEGAAVLTLETLEGAVERGARILGEVTGYGAATDVHHLTQPHPEGEAARVAMEQACWMAGETAETIDYVNAHGTGTPLNDAAEGAALTRWAGGAAGCLRVSSTKGGIGHLLGAAGAVEAVICLMAMDGGWVPPGQPVTQVDPACGFRLVTAPEVGPVRVCLSNSFGFGGANATLVLRRCG